MTVTKKLIGRLPILLGEYDSTKTYSKRQRVTLYGSEFESKVDNNTIAPATLNNGTFTINDNNWRVVSNGTEAFLAGEKIKHFNEEDNPEFVSANTDNDGRILESTDINGKKTFYGDVIINGNVTSKVIDSKINDVTEKAVENKIDKVEGKSLIDENIANSLSEEDNPEYIAVNLDIDNNVIDSIDSDGVVRHNTKHIFENGIEDTKGDLKKTALQYAIDNSSDLAEALKNSGHPLSNTDWSEYLSKDGDYPLHLPEPKCAYVNIITSDNLDRLGTIDGQKAVMQFWDGYGNYFKKKVIINQQGQSTRSDWKRNMSIDLFDDDYDGDAFSIRFGTWVPQDSFHAKAGYNDITRGINVINYHLCNEVSLSRGPLKDRPYKEYISPTSSSAGTTNHDNDLLNDARTISDGFPAIFYLNGEFYGVFAWQLKKHRDNYNMDRNDVTNIHIDGSAPSLFNTTINWNDFEIRNPKPKSKKWKLLCQDGSEYNGDAPKEIMGEDSQSYDSSNVSCVNSAKLKANIVTISKYMSEIEPYENTYNTSKSEQDLAALKAEIEKRFGVSQMIDLIICCEVVNDGDIVKNVQWTTWGKINGYFKMFPCPWDMDSTFHVGSTHASSHTNQNTLPYKYVWKYYLNELKARYKSLRDSGIVSAKAIQKSIMDYVSRVGQDNYKLEFKKWNESPCHRSDNISDKWELTSSNDASRPSSYTTYGEYDTYSATTSYAKGSFVKVSHIMYQSLQDNNIGHAVTESSYWEQVSYKDGSSYEKDATVYDGYNHFRLFKAKEKTTDRPYTKFYSHYPEEGGNYDSALRMCAWIEEKIAAQDKLWEYNV